MSGKLQQAGGKIHRVDIVIRYPFRGPRYVEPNTDGSQRNQGGGIKNKTQTLSLFSSHGAEPYGGNLPG